MPRYDYECSSCGHKMLDIYQQFSDKALKKCENFYPDSILDFLKMDIKIMSKIESAKIDLEKKFFLVRP